MPAIAGRRRLPAKTFSCLACFALITSERHEFGHGATRRVKFHRNDSGIANDLATVRQNLLRGLLDVIDLDGEMVNAWSLACCLGLRRLRACVIFHQSEIDLAVGHVTRYVIARLPGFSIGK